MKICNLILPSSFYPNFQKTSPCDDYVLLGPDWGLLQMWLHESLVKEFLCRCWESALGVAVMEGVYVYAASVNQRLLFHIQEAWWANGYCKIKANWVFFISHIAVWKKAGQLYIMLSQSNRTTTFTISYHCFENQVQFLGGHKEVLYLTAVTY